MTRNTGWGSASWLGDEWVDAIARGTGRASPDDAQVLADEVLRYRRLRRLLADDAITYGEILEERFGTPARSLLLGVVARLCATEDPHGCPPTDTPQSAASGDLPPQARSSG